MLAISQKPDRVSNDLRSSTAMSRVIGIRAGVGFAVRATSCSRTASTVVALMLLLLRAGCLR